MNKLMNLFRRFGAVLLHTFMHPIATFVHLLEQFPIIWQLLKDPRVPLHGKIVFVITCIGYAFSPIDLIPEGIAFLGGVFPPLMAMLFLLGISEDFLLGIPLIGKVFIWWARKRLPPPQE